MADIQVIDTHFHLFDFDSPLPYPWPTPDEPILYRNFLPDHYLQERPKQFKYGVFVQTINHSPEEIDYVYQLSKKYDFIKGIVGGVDVTKQDVADILDQWKPRGILVGLRQILDLEDPDWLTRDAVIQGLKLLEERQLTFDLLLRPPLLKHVPKLAAQVPNLKMVVDHIAKPYIKAGEMDQWKEEMAAIAQCPNIHCKISGLVTEADLENWKPVDFRPYVEHIVSIFGVERIMFGSDWPVMKLAHVTLPQVYKLATSLLFACSPEDKQKIFYSNAIRFYNLKILEN